MNDREYEILQRQLQAIRRMSSLVAHPYGYESLLSAVLEVMVETIPAEAASLALIDTNTGELCFRETWGPVAPEVRRIRLSPPTGIIGWVAANRQPALAPNAPEDPRFDHSVDHTTGFQTQSILAAPISIEGRCLGAVELINSCGDGGFTEIDLDLLSAMCDQCAILVQNATLNGWARRKVRELTTLVDVQTRMSSPLAVRELLQLILDSAVEVSGAEASSLLLVDEETHDLVFTVATGEKADAVKHIRLAMGQGVAGWVASAGQPLLVRDTSKEPRFNPAVDQRVHFNTRSLLAVPMHVRDRTIGVLEVVNLPQSIADEDEYVEVISGFAAQAAIAIERAQLYERLEQRIEVANQKLQDQNRELAAQKARVEAMIQGMADGVLVIDTNNRVLLANAAAAALLGETMEPATGVSLANLPHDDLLVPLAEAAWDRSGEVVREEIQFSTGEGGEARTLRCQVTLVTDDAGNAFGTICLLSDVTELKELSRMKSELVSLVSHELRAPLTCIKAMALTLLRSDLPSEQRSEFLGLINSQCDRLNSMVGSLLNVSRIESGRALEMNWQMVQVPQLFAGVIDTMSPAALHHSFATEVENAARVIMADEDKLKQILINLVDNAIKYSPQGGEIRLVARIDGEAVFEVHDSGIGISPEEQRKLFSMFERTDGESSRVAGGTGLGLYLVRQLVLAHQGTIGVESIPGKGSCFSVRIPLDAADKDSARR